MSQLHESRGGRCGAYGFTWVARPHCSLAQIDGLSSVRLPQNLPMHGGAFAARAMTL
jgi:hypothetical protein